MINTEIVISSDCSSTGAVIKITTSKENDAVHFYSRNKEGNYSFSILLSISDWQELKKQIDKQLINF